VQEEIMSGASVSGEKETQPEAVTLPSDPHHEPGKLHEPLGAAGGETSPACTVAPAVEIITVGPSTSALQRHRKAHRFRQKTLANGKRPYIASACSIEYSRKQAVHDQVKTGASISVAIHMN
jgi:hypothetical protein